MHACTPACSTWVRDARPQQQVLTSSGRAGGDGWGVRVCVSVVGVVTVQPDSTSTQASPVLSGSNFGLVAFHGHLYATSVGLRGAA